MIERLAYRTLLHGHLAPETVNAIVEGYSEWKAGLGEEEQECLDHHEMRLTMSMRNFADKSAQELMAQLLLQVRRDRTQAKKMG